MQRYSLDIIGTHLEISLHTERDMERVFQTIEKRLTDFEARFSRFISGNWLFTLNRDRRGFLDTDAQSMLSCMLDIAKKTD